MPKQVAARKGIRRKGNRWEVSVRVPGARPRTSFPLDTPLAIMQAWRASHRVATIPKGALGDDAQTYLTAVKHMPDYKNRVVYLERLVNRLGVARSRHTITAIELDTVLSELSVRYAPTTVRHHRSVLIDLWKRLDGPRAVNPARDTTRPQDRPPQHRAAPIDAVARVLKFLRPGKTRARLMLILATGLPHALIKRLTPVDWNHAGAQLQISARRKGRGAAARVLPLSASAAAALEEFDRVDAWGWFSNSGMHSAVHRACDRLQIPRFRPYDVRHWFGRTVYQQTGDLATVARLLGHADQRTSQRYAASAFEAVDRAAAAKVGAVVETMAEIARITKESR